MNILIYVLIGFVVQMIDGALGMAYGVSANAFILATGVPPALASASVHFAEMFVTGISGTNHFRLGNVDAALFKRLVIPGSIGGIVGAYILSNVSLSWLKPVIAVYLLAMGVRIIWLALRGASTRNRLEGKWI